jgi:adenylosuccinate lyase
MKETKIRILIALALVAVMASIAAAAATGTTAIKERQAAMKDIGKAMKNLGSVVKKEAPFDAAAVKANAETIASHLKKSADLFPEGSDKGDVETHAKANVWSDRENFDRGFETAHAAAVKLQSVTDEAALRPALGALGNSCKTCHDTYRRPEE